VHAKAAPFSMVVMCPPHLVKKWAREAILTVPFARTAKWKTISATPLRSIRKTRACAALC
jgi:hypothetical protein